ncbi:formylglycine-generating enzyme family protein [Prosthecobacter sp.]|uniref:formylglycine-generating enzyme family protein n=1 Tax=Prosthecobacter sp. TaxID=1965333 RepID=UPI003783AE9D
MKSPALFLLLATLFWVTLARAEVKSVPEFDELMTKYGNDVQLSAGAIYDAGVTELKAKYVTALERGLKAAQEGGRLEDALAFKEESKKISTGGEVAAESETTSAELKKLRGIYHQSMARLEQDKNKATNPIITALIGSLDRLVVTLTKAGRLDEALFVKQKKDKLGEETSKAEVKAAEAAAAAVTLEKGTFTNTMGMKFVPLPGTEVLMCIHQTRNADYAAFAAETPSIKAAPVYAPSVPKDRSGEHPIRNVRQIDAVAFCEWLSKKEGKTYRLPTDEEWSIAVGLAGKEKRSKDSTPESLNNKNTTDFPWGTEWPPPQGAGNLGDTAWKQEFPKETCIEGYTDGFPVTSPVMTFKPNKMGLYDMGTNVGEWVADWWNTMEKERAYRGAGFGTKVKGEAFSSKRGHLRPDVAYGNANLGFRCILETKK